MHALRHFNTKELLMVDDAVKASEELVNNYFKISSGQWLKNNRYDIKTAKDLTSHEYVKGPFAQVVKYEGHKKDISLSSSCFSLYTICLQDHSILSAIKKKDLRLNSFLLYIIIHELVHVVRFSKFKQRYENKNEADVTLDEERKVHGLTYDILNDVSVEGLKQVFDFYKDWRRSPE
jgi:hypothetical protein